VFIVFYFRPLFVTVVKTPGHYGCFSAGYPSGYAGTTIHTNADGVRIYVTIVTKSTKALNAYTSSRVTFVTPSRMP